ncbi:MAG: DUF4352 domain-containing protein [Patulibacter minatonensis]
MLVAPGHALAAGGLPPLTAAKAKTLVKRAVAHYGLNPRIGAVACRRRSATRQACAVATRDDGDRYSFKVEVTRGGIPTSPVDRFTLTGWKHDQFDGSSRLRESGRFAVETRRAAFGVPLRLWVDGTTQLDAIVSAPEVVVPSDTWKGAEAGQQWVVVRISVTNTGRGRWDGGAAGFDLVLSDGSKAPSSYAAEESAGCSSDLVSAGAGELRTGCLGFQVPAGDAPTVQWKAGFETGVWRP